MKKIVLSIVLFVLLSATGISLKAETATWEKTFIDNFDGYTAGKVEQQPAILERWTNDGWSGTNDNPTDINDVATIKADGANKFLNMKYNSSFFYMAPTNFRANEFEVEFDFRSHDLTDGWIGINMRKEYRDIRYNGGTGMMIYFRTKYLTNLEGTIIGESLVIHALRGGSLSTTDLDSLLVGNRVIEYVYPTGEAIDQARQIKGNWFNVKINVSNTANNNEALYEVIINDTPMASLTYARASLNVAGYFGLHACTGDFDLDDFSIQSLDEVAPPPIIRVNKLVETTGKVGVAFAFPGSDSEDLEVIDDADNKVVIQVVQPNSEVLTIAEGTFAFTPTLAGIHTLKYVVENADGTEATAEFLVNIQAADPVDPEEPEEPEEPVEPETPEEPKNNNTLVIVLSSVGGLVVIGLGVFFLVIKKRP